MSQQRISRAEATATKASAVDEGAVVVSAATPSSSSPPPTTTSSSGSVMSTRLILQKVAGGTIGGILQAICAHPFDTIKSRVQMGIHQSIAHCVTDTIQREGVLALYKGVASPVMMGGAYNAILFSTNQAMLQIVKGYVTHSAPDAKATLPEIMLAAEFTAPVSVLLLVPFDVAKIRLQLQTQNVRGAAAVAPPMGGKEEVLYRGVLDCWMKIVKLEGPAGLFRGYFATWGTRILGLPLYFAAQDVTKAKLVSLLPEDRRAPRQQPWWVSVTAGASAGIAFWVACYPVDLIKTQKQSKDKLSVAEIIANVRRQHGWLGFYRGFTPCLLRAVVANGPVWYGIDRTVSWMESRGW